MAEYWRGKTVPKTDSESYIRKLHITNPLVEPLLQRVIGTLRLPPGSRGLDAGCGVGLQLPLLAEAVGSAGRVTGLDIQPDLLADASKNLKACAGRIDLCRGDVYDPPFPDRSFDWIWSANCAGYPVHEPDRLFGKLKRLLKPGGLLAVLIWASQQLLPGYPRLEAVLNSTAAGLAPFSEGTDPAFHSLRLLGWLQRAGFKELSAQPFSAGVQAPLAADVRAALGALLDMRWQPADQELDPADRLLYARLTDPASPDFILDLPDYYAFFTCTLFRAASPA